MQIYYRVKHGTIALNGVRYPQGAEFTATEKQVQELRAAGVVERVTPVIVYRRAALPGSAHTLRATRPKDSLLLLPKAELQLLRKDDIFVRKFCNMFPDMRMNDVRKTIKYDLVKMIVEKRGY